MKTANNFPKITNNINYLICYYSNLHNCNCDNSFRREIDQDLVSFFNSKINFHVGNY